MAIILNKKKKRKRKCYSKFEEIKKKKSCYKWAGRWTWARTNIFFLLSFYIKRALLSEFSEPRFESCNREGKSSPNPSESKMIIPVRCFTCGKVAHYFLHDYKMTLLRFVAVLSDFVYFLGNYLRRLLGTNGTCTLTCSRQTTVKGSYFSCFF